MNGNLFRRNSTYVDTDLTFVVHTFRDSTNLKLMLESVRRWYPEARVVVCSDGDANPALPKIAESAHAEFHLGQNLYAQGNGAKVCQRLLEMFLHRPTRYCFKVDPDTGFHRRFAYLPDFDGMFGTLQSNSMLCSIQGGFQGFTLNVVNRMYESKVFVDTSLDDPQRTWASHPQLWRLMSKAGRVSTDWMFGYAATVLGIPQFGFPEVMCKWKTPVPNPDANFAITHPVKQQSAAPESLARH